MFRPTSLLRLVSVRSRPGVRISSDKEHLWEDLYSGGTFLKVCLQKQHVEVQNFEFKIDGILNLENIQIFEYVSARND